MFGSYNHISIKQPLHITHVLLGICFLWASLGMNACVQSHKRGTAPATSEVNPTSASQKTTNAEVQLLQTLKTAETLGKGNPLLLSSLYSLAAYYRDQGEYDKAESQYKRALTIKEEMSGPNHPDIIMILHNYAALLRDAERYTEAENLVVRAKAINAKSSSRHHSQ